MTSFEVFFKELLIFLEQYEKNKTQLKIEHDVESTIIKIFGERITSLARAKNGLNDISELAYSTAEHHPFWSILYHCTDISNTVLESWNRDLTNQEIIDMKWALKELQFSLEKLTTKNHD